IYPSPRISRWSGPLNAALAYVLAWGTAGIAVMPFRGVFVDLGALANQHAPTCPGDAGACLLHAPVGPSHSRREFPGSRIAPAGASREPTLAMADPLPVHELRLLTEVPFPDVGDEDRRARLRPAFAQGMTDAPRVRARVVKRLSPRELPEDSFER